MLKIQQVLRNEKGENVLNDYFESINIKGNYIVVKKNGLFGLYRLKDFKKILDCEWDKIVFDRNCILAYKFFKITVFDENGNNILGSDWDKVVLYDKGIVVTCNDLQGFFKYDGTIILDRVCKCSSSL